MNTMQLLTYRSQPVPESIWEAALHAARECAYDDGEEALLAAEVLDVRWVSVESVRALFSAFLEPPEPIAAEEVLRIDWRTWAAPRQFDGRYDNAVVERVESVVVTLATLMAGEVMTYGLGPEYNWLEWDDTAPTGDELPDAAFEALSELIVDEWSSHVLDYADGDPDYLRGIHPRLRDAVAKVLARG